MAHEKNWCSRCKAYRPISDFAPSHQKVHGAWCRACRRDRYREKRPLPEGYGKCEFCGADFTGANARRRFCSENCKQRAIYWRKNPREQRLCQHCGKDISDRRRDVKWCSNSCSMKAGRTPEQRRAYMLRYKYKITPPDYDALLESQAGACAICGSTEPNAQWDIFHVDHCHETGAVRGLLCGPCNTGLGHFKDDIESLRRAVEYLAAHTT